MLFRSKPFQGALDLAVIGSALEFFFFFKKKKLEYLLGLIYPKYVLVIL